MLIKTAAAEYLPVTLARAKKQVRADDFEDDDAYIESLIVSAVKALEDRTGLVLATSGFEYRTSCWFSQVNIPAAPIRDVTAVKYLDNDGVEQTVATSDWYWVPADVGGGVYFESSFTVPTIADRPDAVRIAFTAGFDDPGSSPIDPRLALPATAEMAILFLVGQWYALRESVIVGATALPVPQTFDWLASQLRVFR